MPTPKCSPASIIVFVGHLKNKGMGQLSENLLSYARTVDAKGKKSSVATIANAVIPCIVGVYLLLTILLRQFCHLRSFVGAFTGLRQLFPPIFV